jgi:hypothetical protein
MVIQNVKHRQAAASKWVRCLLKCDRGVIWSMINAQAPFETNAVGQEPLQPYR